MKERFGYDDCSRARDLVVRTMRHSGFNPDNVRHGVILGSGLGTFADTYLDRRKANEASGPVSIPFNNIFSALGIEPFQGGHKDHARELVIGHLRDSDGNNLVIAQSGREHPYDGVSLRRATFWLGVMQLLGVQTLFGSNAAGVLTPHTLEVPSLMLIHSDQDETKDNPIAGEYDERWGEKHRPMNDIYPRETRERVQSAARELNINLRDGTYFRVMGPHYERAEDIYHLRSKLRGIWEEGKIQSGENRFSGDLVGVVGMSTTYEAAVAQYVVQSKKPAFTEGRTFISCATNFAASLGPEGKVAPLSHNEVQKSAEKVQDQFGRLVQKVLMSYE